ncbi:MAG TPA: LysR substrate-binding domain-containing protein [Pseudolabrys sp.]|nr:LysR substrate-binding domain-containing protein [Pseudolabrys sp.]
MINIPTDLLRTLVAVVDLRSFTKAAAMLGVSQPAVSTQIKRLQFLLGSDLFDRSSQGVSLTPHGETVVTHARRLLSINDHIISLRHNGTRPELVIRLGTPSDFVASVLPDALARFRNRWPDVRYTVRTDFYDPLMRQLHGGDLDIMIGLSEAKPHDARHFRSQEVVWVRGAGTRHDPHHPVPLVSYGEPCTYHRLAVKTLRAAGLEWESVFTGPSLNSVSNAVAAGFGVMAITRARAITMGMTIWDDAPLPRLPDLYSGIYVREGGPNVIYEQLADEIAAVVLKPAEAPVDTPFNRMSERVANSAA